MGSIHAYETTAGKRYRVMFRKPDHSQGGKRGFASKRQAELYLATVEVKKASGEFIDAAAGRITVAAIGGEWVANRSHLKPSTRRSELSGWTTHVLPYWGNRPVASIRYSEVQAWITSIAAQRSATTVKRAHGILAAILDTAVRDRRIPSNPARGVKLPRKVGKRRAYLSHPQVAMLAREAGTAHATCVLFLAYTGLRWGEMSALRVRDLDALSNRVRVVQNAVDVGGTIVVGTPKSHVARSVPYPKFLSVPLARLCEGKGREDLLFGDGVSYERLPHSVSGWFVGAVRRCMRQDGAFPVLTVHGLRHTAASLAISSGAHVKAVQKMLGHASAAMTLDQYADLFEDDLDGVAESLERARSASIVAV